MRNALTVYIGLAVLFAIPICWFGLKRLLMQDEPTKKRVLPAVLSAVGLVLLCLLCSVLYQFSIRNQPILVASRFAAEARHGVTAADMVRDGVLSPDAGDFSAVASALQSAGPLQLSKPGEEDSSTYYLLIDEPNAVVAAVSLEPDGTYYYRVTGAALLDADDAAATIKDSSFIPIN